MTWRWQALLSLIFIGVVLVVISVAAVVSNINSADVTVDHGGATACQWVELRDGGARYLADSDAYLVPRAQWTVIKEDCN